MKGSQPYITEQRHCIKSHFDSLEQKAFHWINSPTAQNPEVTLNIFTWSDKFSMAVMLCLVKVRYVSRNYLEHPNMILRTVEPQLEGTRFFHRSPGDVWERSRLDFTCWLQNLCPHTKQINQGELWYSDKNNKYQVSHCPAFTCASL